MGLKNKFEAKIFQQLENAKVPFKYESEKIPYVLACHYIPDFKYEVRNGSILIETKGYLRPEDKRKLVAVKRQHPELDIRIVFYAANKRNTLWATRHGFKWAVGKIPSSWLRGM